MVKTIFLFVIFIAVNSLLNAQVNRSDSDVLKKINISKHKFLNNIFKKAVNSVEKSTPTSMSLKYLNKKSETPFLPYQGKIIRHIYISTFNFDKSIKDTTKTDNKLPTKIGKKLHSITKPSVIKDNLFIAENTTLNAFKVADNEKYLRSLNFIHDARIRIKPIKGNHDSVDIEIFTIDVFSLGGDISSNLENNLNIAASETNIAGTAQWLEVRQLYDVYRKPNTGYGIFYRKSNLLHTFTDATVGISTTNKDAITHQESTSEYLTFSKQLVSPYTKTAGGLTISHNEAFNVFKVPDTSFLKYKYNLVDVWGGYNIAIKKLTASNNTIRDRRFLTLRVYNKNFTELPKQISGYNTIYNNTSAILSQIAFFKQSFYRTQYIYGFGTTEDLPYGYNITATVGWYKQVNLERFYTGVSATEYVATSHGDFLQLYARAGGFIKNNQIQDRTFLIGATAFSRIIFWNSTKIRQYLNINYSSINNLVTYEPLKIDNYYGIRGFRSDSVYGTRRWSLQLETEFYLKHSIYGFKFAPFPYIDISILTPQNQPAKNSLLYSGLGGGVRMRNENLIFETIEIRAYFFPLTPNNMSGFKLDINSNIRYRYTSNFITAPDIVHLNSQ